MFPAGVLQREVLSPERPKYLNYATAGFIVGYIFAQAFEVSMERVKFWMIGFGLQSMSGVYESCDEVITMIFAVELGKSYSLSSIVCNMQLPCMVYP